MSQDELRELLGSIDIYLLDEVMKGRLQPGMSILDAGCGMGRNLFYFAKTGYKVSGIDIAEDDIRYLSEKIPRINPEISANNFRCEAIEDCSFGDLSFDVIICSAVLHFAKNEDHFRAMLDKLWGLLKPNGIFFCRLATSIGIENRIKQLEGRHYLLPDGSRRFLADETFILRHTHRLGASFLEPIKTTNVQNQRCMTTWVLKKSLFKG